MQLLLLQLGGRKAHEGLQRHRLLPHTLETRQTEAIGCSLVNECQNVGHTVLAVVRQLESHSHVLFQCHNHVFRGLVHLASVPLKRSPF